MPRTTEPARTPTTPRVLIVDDCRDNRMLYGSYLRWRGWGVAELANGADALRAALNFQPDVIIMDLAMPVVGGIEATRRLKRNARTRDIPVIVLTSFPWRADEAAAAGCAAFLTKPCTPHDLFAVLENAIDARSN